MKEINNTTPWGVKLTETQVFWLITRGGRTSSDVLKDESGLFVFMGDGNGDSKKVYLPKK